MKNARTGITVKKGGGRGSRKGKRNRKKHGGSSDVETTGERRPMKRQPITRDGEDGDLRMQENSEVAETQGLAT